MKEKLFFVLFAIRRFTGKQASKRARGQSTGYMAFRSWGAGGLGGKCGEAMTRGGAETRCCAVGWGTLGAVRCRMYDMIGTKEKHQHKINSQVERHEGLATLHYGNTKKSRSAFHLSVVVCEVPVQVSHPGGGGRGAAGTARDGAQRRPSVAAFGRYNAVGNACTVHITA